MRLASFALAFLAVASCTAKETPEARIKKVLDEGAAALEARDPARAAEVLSESYQDSAGRTKDKLKGLAFFALQQGPVLVSMQTVDIKVDGARAAVTMKVLAIQGSPELKAARDLLPTNARSFDLTLTMANDGGDWRVAAIDGLPRTGASGDD
jgi:hypothetical protein